MEGSLFTFGQYDIVTTKSYFKYSERMLVEWILIVLTDMSHLLFGIWNILHISEYVV